MTANAFAEDEKEALEAGMNIHLAKPIITRFVLSSEIMIFLLLSPFPLQAAILTAASVQMPVMNGYDATRAIRALPREDAVTIPIIACQNNCFICCCSSNIICIWSCLFHRTE